VPLSELFVADLWSIPEIPVQNRGVGMC
jgi:hypothetical protein